MAVINKGDILLPYGTPTAVDQVLTSTGTGAGDIEWQAPTGAVGGGDDAIGYENDNATTGGGLGDYTITTNKNMVTAGALTITAGDTITVPSGSTWTIV